jgi:hypothetical protein
MNCNLVALRAIGLAFMPGAEEAQDVREGASHGTVLYLPLVQRWPRCRLPPRTDARTEGALRRRLAGWPRLPLCRDAERPYLHVWVGCW